MKDGSSYSKVLRKKDLPQTLCPRLASLVLSRLHSKAQQKLVWGAFLRDYNGDEKDVWYAVVSLAVEEAYGSAKRWPDALAVVKRAYDRGVVYHLSRRRTRRGEGNNIPEEIARKVCSAPHEYPIGLVGAASAKLAEKTGASAAVIAKVAYRDDWFVDL